MEESKKSYFAIIPANVRYDKRLKLLSRLLYAEITALTNEKGYCWATNKYFAELYEVSIQTISSCINQLKEFGYINIEMIYKEGTKEILNRYIKIFEYPIKENLNRGIKENFKDNNTYINNTINNTYNIDSNNKNKKFIKPTLEEIKQFIKDKNLKVNEETFYYYYESNGWKVGKVAMKNWQATLRQWNARENKKIADSSQYQQEEVYNAYKQY
jgi:hypothetical protein